MDVCGCVVTGDENCKYCGDKDQASNSHLIGLVIRAFRSKVIGTTSIVFAEKASKARYITYLAANDAGYGVRIVDIKVKRAAEYDCKKYKDGLGFKRDPEINFCHTEEHLLSV